MAKILRCNCESEFQDATYGKNMRVFNEMGKEGKDGYRCTVCGKEIKEGAKK